MVDHATIAQPTIALPDKTELRAVREWLAASLSVAIADGEEHKIRMFERMSLAFDRLVAGEPRGADDLTVSRDLIQLLAAKADASHSSGEDKKAQTFRAMRDVVARVHEHTADAPRMLSLGQLSQLDMEDRRRVIAAAPEGQRMRLARIAVLGAEKKLSDHAARPRPALFADAQRLLALSTLLTASLDA